MDKLQKIIRIFKDQYSEIFSCALLVGSAVYSGKVRDGGDGDVVVIMNDLSEWYNACEHFCLANKSDILAESKRLFNKGRVQYFSLKPTIDGTPFSIDFILKNTLMDFTDNFDSWTNKKIYKTSAVKQGKYLIFGEKPDTVRVAKENISYGTLYLVNSPLGVISNNRFYHGILLGKFIGGYDVLWGNEEDALLVDEFCMRGIKKYQIMNHINNIKGVLKSLNKYDSWSNKHLKRQINKYKGCLDA